MISQNQKQTYKTLHKEGCVSFTCNVGQEAKIGYAMPLCPRPPHSEHMMLPVPPQPATTKAVNHTYFLTEKQDQKRNADARLLVANKAHYKQTK